MHCIMRQPLGAINKKTGKYVYPQIANKNNAYICPDCSKDLIFCHGKIKVPYFRHSVDSTNPCNYYDKPNESQIHKDAKLLMKRLLDDKTKISFIRKCDSCDNEECFEIREMTNASKIEVEYDFDYNGKKIADVAYLDNGKILYIFEICNTHKTAPEKRPEPWFEIDALTLINMANDDVNSDTLKVHCIRNEKCKNCISKIEKEREPIKKAKNILLKWFDDKICNGDLVYPPFHASECCIFDCEYYCDPFNTFNNIDDILVYHKENPTCVIHLCYFCETVNTKEHDKQIDSFRWISIYYVDINWILNQKDVPDKIKCIQYDPEEKTFFDGKMKKEKAKNILFAWLDSNKDNEGHLLYQPFIWDRCYVAHDRDDDYDKYVNGWNGEYGDDGFINCREIFGSFADIVISHEGSLMHIVHLCNDNEIIIENHKKLCDKYDVCIHYVSIDWILEQVDIPKEIKYVKQYIYKREIKKQLPVKSNAKVIKYSSDFNIDEQLYIYFEVPFDEKDLAKSAGCKWNNSCKKWYISKKSKNKEYLLSEYKKIVFDKCIHCNGCGMAKGDPCYFCR